METFNSNWFIFFKEIILKSGKFNLETPVKINQVYEVTFKSINDNINTKIISTIDYLDDLLISINFDNPKTPGLSKYQENEYFYKYAFYESGSHGSPGLEYIELNTKVIKSFLLNGLRGYEIQYFNNGKLNKADLFFESNPLFFNTTVYFENRGCLRSLFPSRYERNLNFQTSKIEYNKLLNCVKHSIPEYRLLNE